MSEKIKSDSDRKPNQRINQFIIECLFNKYFEEKEEIASAPSVPRNDKVYGFPLSRE